MANKQPLFLFVEFLKSETTGLLHIKKFDVDNAFPESFTYVSYDEYCRVIESLRRENEEMQAKLDKAKWQPIETAPRDGETKCVKIIDGLEEAIDILEVHMQDMGDMAVVLIAAREHLKRQKGW